MPSRSASLIFWRLGRLFQTGVNEPTMRNAGMEPSGGAEKPSKRRLFEGPKFL
jgi:hypothetical protein